MATAKSPREQSLDSPSRRRDGFSSVSASDAPLHRSAGRNGLNRPRAWFGRSGQTIAELECLERIFEVPDTRPLGPSDLAAANRRHDEMLAQSPWFMLWQQYGVCCRSE